MNCTECEKPAIARGLCTLHYQRFRKSEDWSRVQPDAGEPMEYLLAHMNDGCCTPWPFAKQRGYGWVWGNGARIDAAHVIVCEIANGPRPSPAHHARHLCGKGNLGCFNAECLAWGTAKDNYDDAARHGTATIGERVGTSKLTESDVIEIRNSRGKETQVSIAARFGVSQSLISAIQTNQWWKHVSS